MKKKILIIMPSMFIGGAERSLIGMLDCFDYDSYDVSLFLYRHEGEFLKYIPKQVHLLAAMEAYATFDVPMSTLVKKRKLAFVLARTAAKLRNKVGKNRADYGVWASMQNISRSLLPLLPKIPGEYDVAISYLGIPDVLLYKTDAKKKIAWNHTDYTILGPDKKYDRALYRKLDHIVSVSYRCTEQFLKVYPEFEVKTVTMENVLSQKLLREQSVEETPDFERCGEDYVFLSVGRFSDAKNFDNIPEICKKLRTMGISVIWYIIGYGNDEQLIRSKISEYGMEDYVRILGKKENPYAYMEKCDFYLQPSRYEGKCVSVIEAQLLHKPVIITAYATSATQLEADVDGFIVPMDNDGCARGIAAILGNPEHCGEIIENTKKKDYTNMDQLEKLYSLM